MTEIDFSQIYRIDEKRLRNYFQRIKSSYGDTPFIEIVANFLIDESIASNVDAVLIVLKYFEEKIIDGKNILDFAFEWIRADKIFQEYRKFLNSSKYPSYEVALDDCIFLFFLEYDSIIRNLLKPDTKEFEISVLYEVFLSSHKVEKSDFEIYIVNHKIKCPTVFEGSERIDTKIYTLQQGLGEILKSEYERGLK